MTHDEAAAAAVRAAEEARDAGRARRAPEHEMHALESAVVTAYMQYQAMTGRLWGEE